MEGGPRGLFSGSARWRGFRRALLKGLAGSRWMTNHVDQAMLRDSWVIAARSEAQNPDGQEQQSTKIANSMSLTCSPSHLLRMMQALPNVGPDGGGQDVLGQPGAMADQVVSRGNTALICSSRSWSMQLNSHRQTARVAGCTSIAATVRLKPCPRRILRWSTVSTGYIGSAPSLSCCAARSCQL